MKTDTNNTNKINAELYLFLYLTCMKYNIGVNKYEQLDCSYFFNKFDTYSDDYFASSPTSTKDIKNK